ncbi:MAG: c-type cytochrome [Rhizobiaceae bacterium]|nr:c-type cytochrome [Rhizobiaceae bacterium]
MSAARKLGLSVLLAGLAGAAAFWFLTEPKRLEPETVALLANGDAARGERMFWAAGCASCHARPKAEGDARLELAGGMELKTPFGTFVPPNISSDPQDGIGSWSAEDFGNAMLRGVSPDGQHFYPAFPYASYIRMDPSDVGDLYAFMKTLPAVQGKAAENQLSFPFNMRRGIGLWKLMFLSPEPAVALPADAPEQVRAGQYLVEGPGHCGECHTPRNVFGGSDKSLWLAGAKAAEGEGNVPNITPGDDGIGSWSASDIVAYLETGFTPDYDSVGGSMVEVQRNMAQLPAADREAIAAYLKAIPAHPKGY